MIYHFTEILNTYAQETPRDWPCSVLSTILVLFVLFYIPDIANAQEQDKILGTSTIGDNRNQTMPGPLYDNSSVYANPANVNFSSYENLELGIETEYPSNWDIDDYSSLYSVYFYSLPEHSNDTRDFLRIDVRNDSSVDSIIDFVNVTDADALPSLRFIEAPHNATTLSNASTAKSVYTYNDSMQGEVKVLKLAIENNDKFYVFNYSAQTPNFNNYLPTIEKMIESFKTISVLSYENFDLGIRMKYSNDWNFIEFPNVGTKNVTFFPHLEHNSDTLVNSNRVNRLSIYAHPHSQDLSTVKEDFNHTIDDYKSLGYNRSEDRRNSTFIDSTPTNLLRIMDPAHNVTYSYEEPGSGITIIQTNIITIQNDRVYSISYSFPREEYAYYARIVNDMINSTEFFTPRFDPDTNLLLLLHYPSDFEINPENNTRITFQSIPDSNEKPEFVINVNKEGGSNFNKTNCNLMQPLAFTYINTTLAQEIPADERFFTCQTNNGTVNVLQVNATFKDKTYNFTYRAEPLEFSQSVSTIEKIINSTKIIDSLSVRQVDCNDPKKFNFLPYHSAYNFTTVYDPSYWDNPKDYGNGRLVFTPRNDSLPSLLVNVRPSEDMKLLDIVQETIQKSAKRYSDFKIYLANQTTPSSYDLEFIADGNMTKIIYILNDTNKNVYSLYYNANLDEFYSFQPIIEQMREPNCFKLDPDSKPRTYTGFKVGDKPLGIAINHRTNTTYVANSLDHSVSAINSSNNEVLNNILVSYEPKALAVNPATNTIYVTQTGSVSVIDGRNNTLKANITLDMKSPDSIAVDPSTGTVYVADADSKNIAVIDGIMNKKVKYIQLERDDGAERPQDQLEEIAIAVDPIRNRVYAANPSTADVTVIDGLDYSILDKIPISGIRDIAVNPYTNLAYVVGTHRFAEIDLSESNAVPRYYDDIEGSIFTDVAINPFTYIVYIIDRGQNAIYVIDPWVDKLVTNVTMDSFPTYASVDPYANILYVTNSGSDTVTRINGTTHDVIYGAKFDVNDQRSDYEIPFISKIPFIGKISVIPSKSVDIKCSGKTISDNEYVDYINGTPLKCSAQSKNPFSPLIKSSWSGFDDGNPDNEFNVTQYGTETGTFIDLGGLFQTIGPYLSVIVLVAVGLAASIPSFLPKIRKVFGIAEEGTQKFFPLIPDTGKEETTIISKSDIITVDATVIIGVLIFLSFSGGFEKSEQTQIGIITANIVFPFAISAVLAVRNYDKFATRLMIAGFINLMISVVLIALMRL
jgi:DNA-binding beta-propeller fold protein YncE